MKLSRNKKGSNALGIAGIVVSIILFELIFGYFVFAITNENVSSVFKDNCDCQYLGGCSAYVTVYGANAMIEKCQSQVSTNTALSDVQSKAFFNLAIVGILLFVINLTLIIIGILVIRGIPA